MKAVRRRGNRCRRYTRVTARGPTASAHTHATQALIAAIGHADAINNAIPKLASVVVTLAWNYTWYSKVIFKGEPKKMIEAESVEAL
jgi:putative flippase GtrA